MKEAVGGIGITQIVIFFLILFSAYISVSINMSKAYKVRNEVISIIEKNNGLNNTALSQIQNYMSSVGYRTTGNCNSSDNFGWEGINGNNYNNSSKALFCYRAMEVVYSTAGSAGDPQFPQSAYYQIKVFFSLDIPVINNVFKFHLIGSTRRLYYPVVERG